MWAYVILIFISFSMFKISKINFFGYETFIEVKFL